MLLKRWLSLLRVLQFEVITGEGQWRSGDNDAYIPIVSSAKPLLPPCVVELPVSPAIAAFLTLPWSQKRQVDREHSVYQSDRVAIKACALSKEG